MNANKLFARIIEKGGLPGAVARTYKMDENKKNLYLKECSEMCDSKLARNLWGEDLIAEIKEFGKNKRVKHKRGTHFSISVALRIKIIRRQKGIKQAVIASSLNMTQSSYSKIEDGSRSLTLDQFYVIASILNTAITELLDFTNENNLLSNAML